jgi:hypothetical protein
MLSDEACTTRDKYPHDLNPDKCVFIQQVAA